MYKGTTDWSTVQDGGRYRFPCSTTLTANTSQVVSSGHEMVCVELGILMERVTTHVVVLHRFPRRFLTHHLFELHGTTGVRWSWCATGFGDPTRAVSG